MESIKLKKAVSYEKERLPIDRLTIDTYISTDNLLPNKVGYTQIDKLPKSTKTFSKYKPGNILVSNIRPYLKKIILAKTKGGVSSDVLNFKVQYGYDPRYIYYNLFQDRFFEHMMLGSKGTKMPRGDKAQILDFKILEFDLKEQKKIASFLSALDDKIELNNQINSELESLAKTIYDYWFVQFDFPDENGEP